MVKVALQLALLSSPFTAMDMVGGGDPDARTERCLRNPVELVHDNTTLIGRDVVLLCGC